MDTPANYAELVAHAEKAVAAVKDPELKRIAFQKILDDLLAAQTPAGQKKTTRKKTQPTASGGRKRVARGGPQAYVEELADEEFFKKPKTIAQVKAELENSGHHIPLTSLSGPLQKLCQRKVLRRQRVKTGKKQNFAYSNY